MNQKMYISTGINLEKEYKNFKSDRIQMRHSEAESQKLFRSHIINKYNFDPTSEESVRRHNLDIQEPDAKLKMYTPTGIDLKSEYRDFRRDCIVNHTDVSYTDSVFQYTFRGHIINKYGFDPMSEESAKNYRQPETEPEPDTPVIREVNTVRPKNKPKTIYTNSKHDYYDIGSIDEPKQPTKEDIAYAKKYAEGMHDEAMRKPTWFGGRSTRDNMIKNANNALEKAGLPRIYKTPSSVSRGIHDIKPDDHFKPFVEPVSDDWVANGWKKE